jgi:hypothetical protein
MQAKRQLANGFAGIANAAAVSSPDHRTRTENPMTARRLAFLAVVLVAGCSKIHESRSFEVEPGGSHSVAISAPLSEQTIKVTATSDSPINVWVLLDKNVGEIKDDFNPETLKEGIIAKEKNTKDATLTATIPAKENYRIFINGATKKASVTVKVDSQ